MPFPRLFAFTAAAVLAGCSFAPGGGQHLVTPDGGADDARRPDADQPPDPDAGPLTDGAPTDAPGLLPIDSECTPVAEQCAPGLTCRIRGSSTGRCRPVGPFPAGAACTGEDECGANMACIPAEGQTLRCFVVCDRNDPLRRCSPSQTCAAFWAPTWPTGVCVP